MKDRANLNFLLNAPKDLYIMWATNCTFDDLKYAEELLSAYSKELQLMDFEFSIEDQIESMEGKFEECREVLKKFHVY
jgi:hypothetical protein